MKAIIWDILVTLLWIEYNCNLTKKKKKKTTTLNQI